MRCVADLQGEARVSTPVVNPEQAAAIAEPGVVFVSAGAGTGKTTVLVERVALAVLERGLSLDSILVITYTERAAGELRERVRERLRAAGRRDLARDVDGAWISTIHGFCARVLRMHPFEAGVDPRFRVLDESQASVLAAEAFTDALASFCAGREPERLGLLAAYGARGLRSMLLGVYGRLRSAGRPLGLAIAHTGELPTRLDELRAACEAAAGLVDTAARAELDDYLALAVGETPERLRQLPDPPETAGGDVADAAEAVRTAALEHIAARDRMLLEELLRAIDSAYTAREGPRVRGRLRGPAAARTGLARPGRGREDGAAPSLPLDHGGRVPGHEQAAVRARRHRCGEPRRSGRAGPGALLRRG